MKVFDSAAALIRYIMWDVHTLKGKGLPKLKDSNRPPEVIHRMPQIRPGFLYAYTELQWEKIGRLENVRYLQSTRLRDARLKVRTADTVVFRVFRKGINEEAMDRAFFGIFRSSTGRFLYSHKGRIYGIRSRVVRHARMNRVGEPSLSHLELDLDGDAACFGEKAGAPCW